MDGAQLAAGKEAIEMFDAVEGEDGYAVAEADSGRVAQPVRQAVGPLVEFSVGQARFRA